MTRRRKDMQERLTDNSARRADAAIYGDGTPDPDIFKGLSQLKNAGQVAEENGLAMTPSGTLQIGGYVLTGNGLVTQGDPTESDWEQVGDVLMLLEGKIQLLLGDWLVHGETVWGKTYDELAQQFNREK
ncbi:MAG: hypothetical protein AAF787_24880, partial [Chloroflexota bacterium]